MRFRLILTGDHYKIKIDDRTYSISKLDKSGYIKIAVTSDKDSLIIRYKSKDVDSENISDWCNWNRPCYLRQTKDIEKDWWLI